MELNTHEIPLNDENVENQLLELQNQFSQVLSQTHVNYNKEFMEELNRMQTEEFQALESIYGSDFRAETERMFTITIRSLAESIASISMTFRTPKMYPNSPPVFEFSVQRFSRKQAENLWAILLKVAKDSLGKPMIFDLTQKCQEYLLMLENKLMESEKQKILQEVNQVIEENDEMNFSENYDELEEIAMTTYISFKVSNQDSHLLSALHLIEYGYDILKIECVKNPNLQATFENLCLKRSPRWAFHGTNSINLPSIVGKGLLVPGTDSGIKVVNGSVYGVGIYLAKDPSTSAGYSHSPDGIVRLLICQVLVDPRFVTEHSWGYVVKRADHVFPSYVVDIIPLSELKKIQEINFNDQDQLTEYAKRHFPEGYGTATGSSFQILEIAPRDHEDDDFTSYEASQYFMEKFKEEGEYQSYRTGRFITEVPPEKIEKKEKKKKKKKKKKSHTN